MAGCSDNRKMFAGPLEEFLDKERQQKRKRDEADQVPPSPERPMYDDQGQPVQVSPVSGKRRRIQRTLSTEFPPW